MAGEPFDQAGSRKNLTHEERGAFLKAADRTPREVRTSCHLLHSSGCRISEALALTGDRVDFTNSTVTFESLKKRRGGVYRSVPVPPTLLDALDLVHNVRETEARRGWGRKVKGVMKAAGLGEGPQVSPKGLRHGFGSPPSQRASR